MKSIKHISFEEFYKINEHVARTSPMRTHYESKNLFERWLWEQKKIFLRSTYFNIKKSSLIDLGCGDGRLIDCIDKSTKYTGIDISPTQISAAKKYIQSIKRKNAIVVIGDVLNLPYKDNTFDYALACDVVEHVLDPLKLFEEVRRVVKKEGYIIFSIPNERLWQASRAVLFRFPLHSPDHLSEISISDIKKRFPKVVMEKHIPISFSSNLSLINILMVQNIKK